MLKQSDQSQKNISKHRITPEAVHEEGFIPLSRGASVAPENINNIHNPGNAGLMKPVNLEAHFRMSVPENISQLGLQYQAIPGDGHCLYRAIGLYLQQDDVQITRECVAKHLEDNREKYIETVNVLSRPGQTFESYVAGIRAGEWGDDLEISILMESLHRAILVVHPSGRIDHLDALEKYPDDAPIFVYYNDHNHYDALIQTEQFSAENIVIQLKEFPKTDSRLSSAEKISKPRSLPSAARSEAATRPAVTTDTTATDSRPEKSKTIMLCLNQEIIAEINRLISFYNLRPKSDTVAHEKAEFLSDFLKRVKRTQDSNATPKSVINALRKQARENGQSWSKAVFSAGFRSHKMVDLLRKIEKSKFEIYDSNGDRVPPQQLRYSRGPVTMFSPAAGSSVVSVRSIASPT